VREVTGEVDEGMAFTVDGTELHAYQPSDGQLAVLMASVGRHTSMPNQVAGVINFFVEVMDEPSHVYVVERLLDRTDPFGLAEVKEIMEWMVEEWSGRPTQSPSVSTRSRKNGGPRSTPPTSASTSSDSLTTAS
jgi:hypothetical protein